MRTKFKAWKKTNDPEMFEDIRAIDFEKNIIRIGYKLSEYTTRIDEESLDNVELLQSTGLFDKNEKEIFEGDIVTAMSEGIKGTGVVKRRIDGYWFMYPAWQNGQSWKLVVSEQGDTDVEIIGNKFEHPHLLGED
ncbi:YopX family protein [Mammaliicoccus sciuri]|uniref:YopX family protein n=2 Tax=Mammaliicoccus sciuri TaxID=1296 RepID=A0AAW5LKZ3_MAMSC|nr:YopX family protein [Mammaliicoccus sciuri]MCQ9303074.1 YopX family protein [Mammaliicoccus sciuri]